MTRTIMLSFVLISIIAVLQSTWLGAIAIFGIIPDLCLIVIVWIGFNSGIITGSIIGFISGIVVGFLTAAPFGLHAFLFTAIGAISGIFNNAFHIDKIVAPMVFGFGATIIKALILAILSGLFASRVHGYDFLDYPLWVETAYNVLASPIIFLLLIPLGKILTPRRNTA